MNEFEQREVQALKLMLSDSLKIVIREQISITLEDWIIVYRDGKNAKVHFTAIPPTKGNRIDIILETREDNGFKIIQKYLYNYTGNIKKLKGEKIVITIIAGKPSLNYF